MNTSGRLIRWRPAAHIRRGGERLGMSRLPYRPGQVGQATPLVIGFGVLLMFLTVVVFLLGRTHTAKAVAQTGADLTAVQVARIMRADLGAVAAADPGRRAAWQQTVRRRAEKLARANGSHLVAFSFPDQPTWPPTEVQVSVDAPGPMSTTVRASARAVIRPGLGGLPEDDVASPLGPAYSGPLVYRDGKPMCPAVAQAFDRMHAAAARSGVSLVVNSAFRSDREQAALFARHPDPKWVAPPGRSRHRMSTELDIAGTPGAWDWLARHSRQYGFVQRYSWEAWHFGYIPGCGGITSQSSSIAVSIPGGPKAPAASVNLPGWVPSSYRPLIVQGAREGGVPPIVLAALLKAESDFRPTVVSPVGARGLAQLMPGTARGLGVTDPFDPQQAIPAAGRYLGQQLRRFGSVSLALAAYNAGPNAVARYGGIPPYRETQAYVARILALIGDPSLAGGEGAPDVELVRIDDKYV